LRVASNILGPKLPHDPLYVIGVEVTSVWMLIAESTHAQDPRKWIAGGWRKGRIGRLMDNALPRNAELVAPD
jgi:hypothetical protein